MTRGEKFKTEVVSAVVAEAKKAFAAGTLAMAVQAAAQAATELVIHAVDANCRMDHDFSRDAARRLQMVWAQHAPSSPALEHRQCIKFIHWATRAYVAIACPPAKTKAADAAA